MIYVCIRVVRLDKWCRVKMKGKFGRKCKLLNLSKYFEYVQVTYFLLRNLQTISISLISITVFFSETIWLKNLIWYRIQNLCGPKIFFDFFSVVSCLNKLLFFLGVLGIFLNFFKAYWFTFFKSLIVQICFNYFFIDSLAFIFFWIFSSGYSFSNIF